MPRHNAPLELRLTIAGTPVYLHGSLLLSLLVAWLLHRDFNLAAVSALAFVALMAIHELGHAIAAKRAGMRVHGIWLYAVHGLCLADSTPDRRAMARFVWGGVAAQALLLALAIVSANILGGILHLRWAWLNALLFVVGPLNAFILLVNLLPIAPLDGAVAWSRWRDLFSASTHR